jgi:hypothetical protein
MNPHPDLTSEVIRGPVWIYLILFAMNALWTWREAKRHASLSVIASWSIYAVMLGVIGVAHITGGAMPEHFLIRMPDWVKARVDALADPTIYFAGSIALFVLVIWLREWLVKPTVAWILLNISILFMALSLTDYDFRQIVGKPDNVPIVSMLFIVAFFTWLYFKRAVDNDQRIAAGKPLFEQEDNDKVLVWPDLVYTEMICMVILTAVLVVWGIVLQAPLEEPASAVKTPNPSKAPWYFLGLQEMLVYYDPWMDGVVLPSMILVGLMALPYIDFNKKGNGYYTFAERKWEILTFQFGYLVLWVMMIITGTFFRGPNQNFFGPFERWDVHKVVPLSNINLSEVLWVKILNLGLPGNWLVREGFGIIVVVAYFTVIPMLLGRTVLKRFFEQMPEMDRPIGVRQRAGDQYFAGRGHR